MKGLTFRALDIIDLLLENRQKEELNSYNLRHLSGYWERSFWISTSAGCVSSGDCPALVHVNGKTGGELNDVVSGSYIELMSGSQDQVNATSESRMSTGALPTDVAGLLRLYNQGGIVKLAERFLGSEDLLKLTNACPAIQEPDTTNRLRRSSRLRKST
jgi:hypothetical protein